MLTLFFFLRQERIFTSVKENKNWGWRMWIFQFQVYFARLTVKFDKWQVQLLWLCIKPRHSVMVEKTVRIGSKMLYCSKCHKKDGKMGRSISIKGPTFTFPLTKLAMSSLLSKTDKVCRRFCSSQSQCWFISSNVAPGLEQKKIPKLNVTPRTGAHFPNITKPVFVIKKSWSHILGHSRQGRHPPLKPWCPSPQHWDLQTPAHCHMDGPGTHQVTLGAVCAHPVSLADAWTSYHMHSSDGNTCNYAAVPGETSPPKRANSEQSHTVYPVRTGIPQEGPQPRVIEERASWESSAGCPRLLPLATGIIKYNSNNLGNFQVYQAVLGIIYNNIL